MGSGLSDLGGVSVAKITDGYQKRAPRAGEGEMGGAAGARQPDAKLLF